MKKFIVHISIGIVGFCFLWVAAEVLFDRFKGVNEYSYKYDYVKNNGGVKTLLIGHSHFENGLNPYLLGDSVFNFALGGRGNWMGWEIKLAEDLYHTMPNLKIVIYPLGYNTAFESPHFRRPMREEVKEYMYFYTKYMHAPYDQKPEKYKYYSALYFNKMGPKYWTDVKLDSLGYNPFEGQMPDWQNQHNVNDSSFYFGEVADKCYAEYIKNFIKLAEICNEHDIRLIVLTCPCSDAFTKNTRPEIIKKMESVIDSVRLYYPVEYKNYMNDEEFRADSIYYNSSHLNSMGADKFAKRVKKDFNL